MHLVEQRQPLVVRESASQDAVLATFPFSPARVADGWVFLSGQGGFAPESGELVNRSIEGQTEQTLRNIATLLEQHGCTLNNVVSCLVHLSDLTHFGRFNDV